MKSQQRWAQVLPPVLRTSQRVSQAGHEELNDFEKDRAKVWKFEVRRLIRVMVRDCRTCGEVLRCIGYPRALPTGRSELYSSQLLFAEGIAMHSSIFFANPTAFELLCNRI